MRGMSGMRYVKSRVAVRSHHQFTSFTNDQAEPSLTQGRPLERYGNERQGEEKCDNKEAAEVGALQFKDPALPSA
jgi:hypothetical protein